MEKRVQIGVLFIIFIVAASIFFVAFSGYSQEEVTTVDDSALAKKMRPPVPFAHDEHNEAAEIEDCNICHHVFEDGKPVEDDSSEDSECSECHGSEEENYPMELVKTYHLQCKNCHLEKKAGPVLCAECHPRN
jgi:hypothetical protein